MYLRSRLAMAALACTIWTAGPLQAKELTIALASEPTSIDPHFHNLGPNNSLASHFFNGLVMFDAKQRVQPGLAESWKPIDDLTWEFKLRKGVKWHDGSPFTADDVVFTMGRADKVPNSPSSFGTYIKGKTAVKIDDHTVHIKTKTPYPLMVTDMTTIHIISKKHAEGATTADFNSGKAAIGTGPFKFVEYVAGDRIVMTANENYWGGKPKWDKVT